MFKSVLAAAAAAPFMATAAFAGPYVNVEANSGSLVLTTLALRSTTMLVTKVLWVLMLLGMSKQALPSFFLTAVLLTGFLQVRQVLALV